MAVGPRGVVTFVGTRKELVYSMTDRNKDRVADDVKVFAPSLQMAVPNGVCFSRDGHLYLAEQNRVVWFPAAEFTYELPDVAAIAIVKQGELIPASDESFNHTARTCRVGPDGRIYITIGQPFNVPSPECAPGVRALRYRRHHQHETGRNRPPRSTRAECETRSASTSIRRTRRFG